MITSSRSSNERVAEWRIRSICSLMEEFLLDIGVGARDIGLGLVVVVIRHEIFDGVVREEAPELAIELGRERLVGGEDQGRALGRLDHLGHGEGLAGAGDAEQHLGALVAAADALHQFGDRLGLVALGLEIGLDDEALAALGFLRPRRPVRHPGLLAKLRPALAQQRFQRLRGGGDAAFIALPGHGHDARQRQQAPRSRPSGSSSASWPPRRHRPARAPSRGRDRSRRARGGADNGATSPHSRTAAAPGTRPASRRAPMSLGKIVAPVARIVGRRLQAGFRGASARSAIRPRPRRG